MSSPGLHNLNSEHNRGGGECPAFETLSAWFDRPAGGEEDSALRDHIDGCRQCQSVMQDLSILRTALQRSTPPAAMRSFRIGTDTPGTTGRPNASPISPPIPVFPVAAAIAAILVIALIAGEMLFSSNGGDPPGSVSGDVLFIDGTPYTNDGNEAEFNAASADDMNGLGGDSAGSTGESRTDGRSFTGWRISQILAVVLFLATSTLWYRYRRNEDPGR